MNHCDLGVLPLWSANGSSHWHFIRSPSLFCGWTTNLEWITTWVTTVQHTSVFQVSLEDIILPPSHRQLAPPHSQVAPPITFLWRSLRALNKFVTDTNTDDDALIYSLVSVKGVNRLCIEFRHFSFLMNLQWNFVTFSVRQALNICYERNKMCMCRRAVRITSSSASCSCNLIEIVQVYWPSLVGSQNF